MEIVPGIHVIEGISAHCYLIDGPELTLIDTGMPRKTKKILRYITDTLQKNSNGSENYSSDTLRYRSYRKRPGAPQDYWCDYRCPSLGR